MSVNVREKSNLLVDDFFSSSLALRDPSVMKAMQKELIRQQEQIELIASENIVSRAVLQAQGSVMTNKYAEGYPAKRYYGGCEYVDIVEELAIERAKQLFSCDYANVQPHSGSQANQAVLLSLVNPGENIMGMSLAAGGHLTHGAKPNLSGKWFNSIQYGVSPETHLIDFDEVSELAIKNRPKLIIAGGSAYPREIDFKRFRDIADRVGAFLLVDMAHFSGIVASGDHPSPFPHAHVVTSTTHKTLRGPRGGLILSNDEEISKKLNSAIFPGLQGGPLMHVIAAKAVAFGEALSPQYRTYIQCVIENAKTLAATLVERGCKVITDGTDTHLILVDLRPKGLTGNVVEKSLERSNITCNKNGIPFDPEKPTITSGIRLGTPACTTRGMGLAEFRQIGHLIADVLDCIKGSKVDNITENIVKKKIKDLCKKFPIYSGISE